VSGSRWLVLCVQQTIKLEICEDVPSRYLRAIPRTSKDEEIVVHTAATLV
jgi:hypothetical protein